MSSQIRSTSTGYPPIGPPFQSKPGIISRDLSIRLSIQQKERVERHGSKVNVFNWIYILTLIGTMNTLIWSQWPFLSTLMEVIRIPDDTKSWAVVWKTLNIGLYPILDLPLILYLMISSLMTEYNNFTSRCITSNILFTIALWCLSWFIFGATNLYYHILSCVNFISGIIFDYFVELIIESPDLKRNKEKIKKAMKKKNRVNTVILI